MLQIINGFKELVKMGVIHRDLKPANILNHEGIVKIAGIQFSLTLRFWFRKIRGQLHLPTPQILCWVSPIYGTLNFIKKNLLYKMRHMVNWCYFLWNGVLWCTLEGERRAGFAKKYLNETIEFQARILS